ncbi:MAG TPA: ferritin family protein [Burkholderiales bacterium]|jgi:rubrerythrin|nr:ferritin family protein [Burkholderiales bacterium]
MKPIQSAPELYAHAIAIEREAAVRYGELARQMTDRGNEAVADIFAALARMETEHLASLEARTAGLALPGIAAGKYQWFDDGAPETAAHEWLFRLITPHQALRIALDAEKRAQAFFERVMLTCDDAALRALAREMAEEENEHVSMVSRLIERTPEPVVDWASIYESSARTDTLRSD